MPADRRLKPNVWSMAGTGDNMKNLFKKGTRAAVILIMLVFWCLPVQASGQSGSAEPVPEGYTPIHNSDDLYGIRNDLTANYILMNDIDLSEDTAVGGALDNQGKGWDPIDGFSGIFDGNGHRISGMKIRREMTGTVGLFGTVAGETVIKNLGLTEIEIDVSIDGRGALDAVAVGGIVGNGYPPQGGKVARIEQCYTSGTISVTSTEGVYAGGLAGAKAQAENSYNACEIKITANPSLAAPALIGGITGLNSGLYTQCCYNVGRVTLNGELEGTDPIAGLQDNPIRHCYALSGTAGDKNSGCKLGNEAQMKNKSFLTGFDFETVWETDPYSAYQYPQLKSNRQVRISSIELKSMPDKTEYELGEELDLTGGEFEVVYEDGAAVPVPMSEAAVSGYDKNRVGQQEISVAWGSADTSFSVTVKEAALKSIALNPEEAVLERNQTLQITVLFTPSNVSDKTITWESGNPAVAKVDSNGVVQGLSRGTAIITACAEGGTISAECRITVKDDSPSDDKDNDNNDSNGNDNNENGDNGNDGTEAKIRAITSVKGSILSVKSVNGSGIQVKVKKNGKAQGYQVECSLKSNFKNAKKVSAKGTTLNVKKLKSNKKYYVRARIYGKVKGKTYYGAWSAKKTVKVKDSIIFYSANHTKYSYTGGPAVSKIALKKNKVIVTGSLRSAPKESQLYGKKAKYCPRKTRTFPLDKKFKFYGSAEHGRYRISSKEGKALCRNANGLEVIFKLKNGKVVSISFVS